MKKFISLFLFILPVFLFSLSEKAPEFTYSNKNVGIGIVFPDNWQIFTNKENSNSIFKQYFKENKDPDESPLMYGMQKNYQAFVRILIEKSDMDLSDYIKLFNTVILSEKSEFKEATINEKKGIACCTFDISIKSMSLRYREIIIKNNGYFIRLSFWCLRTFHSENLKTYNEIENNFYLFENDKWIKKFDNLKDNFILIDYIKTIEDKVELSNKFEKDDKAFIYEVNGKKNKVYILGSIHIGHPDFYPMPDRVENAYKDSPNTVFEVNLYSEENKLKTANILKNAILPDNKTIDMVISKKLYDKLLDKVKDYSLTLEKIKNYKPVFLATMLLSLEAMKAGYLEKYGVDRYFLEKSEKDKKNILELESFDSQINLFNNKIDPEYYLNNTLDILKVYGVVLKELIIAWKKSDEKNLERLVLKSSLTSGNKEFTEILFDSRNTKMTEKIKDYLNDDKNYFVVVGAGHLLGDKGIINLLKQAGYEIK